MSECEQCSAKEGEEHHPECMFAAWLAGDISSVKLKANPTPPHPEPDCQPPSDGGLLP